MQIHLVTLQRLVTAERLVTGVTRVLTRHGRLSGHRLELGSGHHRGFVQLLVSPQYLLGTVVLAADVAGEGSFIDFAQNGVNFVPLHVHVERLLAG